jgi:hypothetical protein
MKAMGFERNGGLPALLFCLVMVLATGCATGPRIDWNSRIGTYTYDQAVLDMGPPDKVATLTNGTKVAEWLVSRSYAQGVVPVVGPYEGYPYFYGPAFTYYSAPPAPNRYLQLTFGPDGRLAAWKKVTR